MSASPVAAVQSLLHERHRAILAIPGFRKAESHLDGELVSGIVLAALAETKEPIPLVTLGAIEEQVRVVAAATPGWSYRAILRREEKSLWFGIAWSKPTPTPVVPAPTPSFARRVIHRAKNAVFGRFRRSHERDASTLAAELARKGARLGPGGQLTDFYEVEIHWLLDLAKRFGVRWEVRGASIVCARV